MPQFWLLRLSNYAAFLSAFVHSGMYHYCAILSASSARGPRHTDALICGHQQSVATKSVFPGWSDASREVAAWHNSDVTLEGEPSLLCLINTTLWQTSIG